MRDKDDKKFINKACVTIDECARQIADLKAENEKLKLNEKIREDFKPMIYSFVKVAIDEQWRTKIEKIIDDVNQEMDGHNYSHEERNAEMLSRIIKLLDSEKDGDKD